MPAALDSSAVHAMSGSYAKGEKLGFFWVPERNRCSWIHKQTSTSWPWKQ
jgi:hypothetical protein